MHILDYTDVNADAGHKIATNKSEQNYVMIFNYEEKKEFRAS